MKNQPRYTVIVGRFHIYYSDLPRGGPQPDGDTVTFEPTQPALVERLKRFSGRPPRFNGRGMIPVRFEGIDALETHFQDMHQDLKWAKAARDALLGRLGFGEVVFWDDRPNNVKSVQSHPVSGCLLANGIDSNGRVLGLVYAGVPLADDGSRFRVEPEQLRGSANYQQVTEGFAYAELYDTMPLSLQHTFRTAVLGARYQRSGLWPHENVATNRRARIATLEDLQALVMWPKLFRRLAAYFAAGHAGLGAFDDWMREDHVDRDDVLRLPDGEAGNMHDTYLIDGDYLSLKVNPWQLTIAPDPAQ